MSETYMSDRMLDVLPKQRALASAILRRRGKFAFLSKLAANSIILDVGCGNSSPLLVKSARPDCYYIGVDIHDYNQTADAVSFADKYVLADPDQFPAVISRFKNLADGVISSHNLEHCNDYQNTLVALCASLKDGGMMYLSFPCEESTRFPSRSGTLNFFDDATHRTVIPYEETIQLLLNNGLRIAFAQKRYRPLVLSLAGLALEPISVATKKCLPFGMTWALYGFETVIWARKRE